MPNDGLSNIKIEGEKLIAIEDVLGMERARALAGEQKGKAFGLLSSIISRPKAEDIETVYEEKRYEAFWHVVGNSRFEYKRRKAYGVPVDPAVTEVEILGSLFTPSPQPAVIHLDGIERCVEEYREELLIDARTDAPGNYSAYLACASHPISSTDELTADGTPIVALEAKPAFLVRKTVNALIKPIQADQILDEQIGITTLSLYFIPVYTFEFHWKAKDKRVTVSFDGATGVMRPQANKIADRLRTSFTKDELFEFGKEIANFVPGGGLAMMVGKKAVEISKK